MKYRRYALGAWYFFRIGYGTYLVLPLGIISTATTVYYLMIQSMPLLKAIFPDFFMFLIICTGAMLPICVTLGYLHMFKLPAYEIEQRINIKGSRFNVDARVLYRAELAQLEAIGLGDTEIAVELRRLVNA